MSGSFVSVSKGQMSQIFEIFGVIMTGILFLIMSIFRLNRLIFIIPICLIWFAYFIYSIRKHGNTILKDWGLNFENLRQSMYIPTIVGLVSVCGMCAFNYIFDRQYIMNGHIIVLLLFYPIWGLLQQLLVQVMLAKNIFDLLNKFHVNKNSRYIITILISALLFGMVHIFNLVLTIGTFCLGLVWTPCYLVNRNIIPLGLYHGWIGAFFYFLILNKDPWAEIISR